MTGSDCNKGYYSVSSLIAHTHDAPLVRENGLVGSIVGCLVILIPVGETRHIINTIKQNKISLSPFDDKRYILDDKIKTLAHGHYKIV